MNRISSKFVDGTRPPRDLVTVCLKALAKEPARRYPSAAALAGDLRRFRRDVPVTARPVTTWERGWRWCRRNRVVAGLSGAVVLLALVSLAVLGASTLVRQERDRAVTAETEARALHGRAGQAERENQARLRQEHQVEPRAIGDEADATLRGPV
jgi:eukaryotic-like serine/threonine-protein kinase